MKQQTHYDVEDLPPTDADTKVALYEQANEIVADSLKDAQRIFNHIEAELHEMFVEAENSGNGKLMNLINKAYDGVQQMAAMMGRQGAALTGANGAIDALKAQRDQTLEELNDLLGALDVFDTDHKHLQAFVETLRENEQEYYLDYAYDITMDNHSEQVSEVISELGDWYRADYMIAHDLIAILEGNKEPNEAQKAALIALLETLDIVPQQDGDA